MSNLIHFSNSVYYKAIRQDDNFNKPEEEVAPKEPMAEKIRQYAQTHQSFSCAHVSFQKYSDLYTLHKGENGWIGRKFTAIPKALISLVGTITYIALTILMGIPALCFGNAKYLKEYTFDSVRGLEEFSGHFMTLFSDRLGSYLVQEAEFYTDFYSCFHSNVIAQDPDEIAIVEYSDEIYASLPVSTMEEVEVLKYFPESNSMEENVRRFKLLSLIEVENAKSGWQGHYLKALAEASIQ